MAVSPITRRLGVRICLVPRVHCKRVRADLSSLRRARVHPVHRSSPNMLMRVPRRPLPAPPPDPPQPRTTEPGRGCLGRDGDSRAGDTQVFLLHAWAHTYRQTYILAHTQTATPSSTLSIPAHTHTHHCHPEVPTHADFG